MKAPFQQVLVFQTDICNSADRQRARALLDTLPSIRRWTVDHEDIDRVLRIEGTELDPLVVCTLLQNAGFACAELPD